MPPSLATTFNNRGYYGSVSHNAKATYQKYLGFFDGNPANLEPLPGACQVLFDLAGLFLETVTDAGEIGSHQFRSRRHQGQAAGFQHTQGVAGPPAHPLAPSS